MLTIISVSLMNSNDFMTVEEIIMSEKRFRNKRKRKYSCLFSLVSLVARDRKQKIGNYWLI